MPAHVAHGAHSQAELHPRGGLPLTTDAGLPDDFSHLIFSTCGLGDHVLAPHETCTEVVGFRPTPYFAGLETATIVLTARGPSGLVWQTRTVEITGRGV
jgi:hypothetical protein